MTAISVLIASEGKRREYLREAFESARVAAEVFSEATGLDVQILHIARPRLRGVNFNELLEQADGEFVKPLDDDDQLTPNSLLDLYNGIGPAMWAVSTSAYIIDTNDPELSLMPPDFLRRSQVPKHVGTLLARNCIHGGTTMYRTEALREVGGMDETLLTAEELDLHLKLLRRGYIPKFVDAITYRYRIHDNNKSGLGLNGGRHFEDDVIRSNYVERMVKAKYR